MINWFKIVTRGFFVFGIIVFLLVPQGLLGQPRLIQHLDATASETIGSTVTRWKDQTSFGNDAVLSTGTIYIVQEDELAWLDFGMDRNSLELFNSEGSDAWLDQTDATDGFCIFLAVKITGFHSNWNDLIGNTSSVSEGFGIRFSSSGSIQTYLGGVTRNGPNIEVGEIVVLAFNYNALTGTYEIWDSKSKNTVSGHVPPKDFSLSDAVTLGSTNNSDRFFKGYVGELKVYDKFLPDNQFQDEQNGLFTKWVISNEENDPPLPDPAAFFIKPHGVEGGTIISMTATEGSDASPPVEYLFTETTGNPGGSSSEWQTNPNYRDGNLNPSTPYAYTVTMRDAYCNVGSASDTLSATTTEYVKPGRENDLEYGAYYGYQGWHYAPGDERIHHNEWVHWFEREFIPDADHIHGDMWPDLREYDQKNLYETLMKYPNGDVAKLYSAFDYSTIDLHVKWMRDYGIKGMAVQRFTSSIDQADKLEQGDKKIRDVMTACEKYGVKFWIMHDSGQGDDDEVTRITNDWKHLVDDLHVLQSPAYVWQNGRPVYGLWGVGVNSRQWVPRDVEQLLDFYQNGEDRYRSYVVAGVPVNWRTDPPSGWKEVFDSVDMISPWRTIFNDPDRLKTRMQEDLAYCNSIGIDYNPVVSPGASTQHLRDSEEMRNWKPRDGGHFLWKQVYEVIKMGSKFMYVAMFDEVDEGTAMYKMAETVDDLPVGADHVPLDEDGYQLPSDWYLQVGTEIQKMLEGKIPLTATLPINPGMASVKEWNKNSLLTVYPVPAKGKLYINYHWSLKNYSILDINGNVLLEGECNNNPINISVLKPGLYFIRIDDNVARFIK